MKLVYLPTNAAWVFLFGDDLRSASIIKLHGEQSAFFHDRDDAITAARRRGLKVDKKGVVSAINPSNMNGLESFGTVEEGAGYYTVVIPPSTPNGLVPRSEWRDTKRTLTRGAFPTEAKAHAWAKEHIGKPYDVRYVPPLERGTEILDGFEERRPRWMR